LSHSSIAAGSSSTLTIKAATSNSKYAARGTYTITVAGQEAGNTHSATVGLTIQ
jgi:hypothetical protein